MNWEIVMSVGKPVGNAFDPDTAPVDVEIPDTEDITARLMKGPEAETFKTICRRNLHGSGST